MELRIIDLSSIHPPKVYCLSFGTSRHNAVVSGNTKIFSEC